MTGKGEAGVGRPARVVLVNRFFHPDQAATSRLYRDLAEALVAERFEVVAVASRGIKVRPDGDTPPAALEGVEVRRVWSPELGSLGMVGRLVDYGVFVVLLMIRLLVDLRHGDVVICGTDPPMASVPVGFIARLRGVRQVNWLQDLFPEVASALGLWAPAGAMDRALAAVRNWSLRAAWANVAIGERMRRRLLDLGVDESRIVVIPNWAKAHELVPIDGEANALRKQWRLESRFVVEYAGNFGRAHDFATFLGAMEILNGDADTTFLFIGGGAKERELLAGVKERGLSGVLRKPYQPESRLSEALAVGDVHLVSLVPALEGLIVPSKIYGISAVGRPIIFVGDPDGEVARYLTEGECGQVVIPGDAEGLAAAIRVYRDDRALCARHGANARRALFESGADSGSACARWCQLLEQGTGSVEA